MFRLLHGAVLLCSLLPTGHGSTVKQLTAENFQKSVLETTDVWLVEFASSEQFILEDKMEGLPKKVAKSGVRVGSMDCDDQSNLKFCRLYGFRGSYALSGFFDQPELNPYTKKTIRKYQGFSGATSPRAIEKFVSKGCPSLIVRANTTEELQDMVFSSDSNVVVILADKDTPTMYYKTLAVRFSRHALKFVYVRSSDEELSQAFPDATQYPAVLVYSQGEATLYEEDVMERAELIDWLKTFAGEELEDNSNKSHENSDDLLVKMKELEGSESRPMSRVVAIVREKANSEVPNWLKFIDEADSAVEFREVRCSSDDQMHAMYSALCQSDAQELPYLLVLPYGLVDKKTVLKMPSKHSLPVTSLDAALKKAAESIPNLVTVINSYDPPERMNQFLVEGVKLNRISILVFSDKATPPSSLKGLAAAEAIHLQVGFITEPTDAVLANFGWSRAKGIPLALGTYYSDGSREKAAKDTNWERGPDAKDGEDVGFRVLYYETDMLGPMRFTSLRLFAGSVYQRAGLAPPTDSAAGSNAASAKAQESIDLINSEADWQASCADSRLGICVMGFLNAPADAGANGAFSIDTGSLSTLTDVMLSMQKQSSAYHFAAGSIACLADFGAEFGVDPFNTPTIAIYSPSKGRYAVFRGSFAEPDLKLFLGQVLRGAETTYAIARPVIAANVDCSTSPSSVVSAADGLDDSDAEDFLAEIRREEAERAAQLEKELAEEKARMTEEAKKGEKKKSTKKKKKTTKKEL